MVTGVTESADVTALRVAAQARAAPDLDVLLLPFDRIESRAVCTWRKASTAWLGQWLARWDGAWPGLPVTAPVDAPVSLLSHQLTPLLALSRGAGLRMLIADGVGVGKTVEAGLLILELRSRGAAARVLVLTPISVQSQWRSQLQRRCRLEASIVDRMTLRQMEHRVPAGVGPFQPPGVYLVSVDLAKQPDVLSRLADVSWDAVIVDEAHGVAGNTARAAALGAIASRARVVALLTATPHAGDPSAFRRLCGFGHLGEEAAPLWFCRRPEVSRVGPPVYRDLHPRPSDEERRASAALRRYLGPLEHGAGAGPLIALVLRKRALSSPAALVRSLQHRLAWLESHPAAPEQPALSFLDDDGGGEDVQQPSILGEPAGESPRAEAARLRAAIEAAARAEGPWSKARTLRRLLMRTRDHVLVFTEYRDTLNALADALGSQTPLAVLHGGLDRLAREAVLERFRSGEVRALIATDVAAEGLNLHHACRLVVHVELPWSPARLEQRNGRVDRLGQTRRVHVWRLLGRAGHETRIVNALATRVERMRADGIDVPSRSVPAGLSHGAPTASQATLVRTWDDPGTVAGLLDALASIRRLRSPVNRRGGSQAAASPRPGLRWVRARPVNGGAPAGVTFLFAQASAAPGTCPRLTAVHLALSDWPAGSPSSWLPDLVAPAAAAIGQPGDELTRALRQRELALLARARQDLAERSRRWQASLFDRRAALVVGAARERAAARIEEHLGRLEALEASVPWPVPALALVVR